MQLRRSNRRACWRGFTLTELLVVVSIIAALSGVLLPALAGARETARSTICMSSVRQLHIANDLYATDHDERLVPGAAEFVTRNLDRWHGARDHPSEAFEADRGPLAEYLDSPAASVAIRCCSSFKPTIESLHTRDRGFEQSCGGYGYNNAFMGVERMEAAPGIWTLKSDRHGARRTRFRSMVHTVAFADAAFAADELIEYSFIEPVRWPDAPSYPPDPSTHFRHDGNANVVWLDGHVTGERRTATAWSGLYPSDPGHFNIGWFGDADGNTLFDYQ